MLRYGARSQQLPINFIAVAPTFKTTQVLEDGTVIEKEVNSASPLPSADTLKIKNVLDAGLPLEEVNSKVLQPDFNAFLGASEMDFAQDLKDGNNE